MTTRRAQRPKPTPPNAQPGTATNAKASEQFCRVLKNAIKLTDRRLFEIHTGSINKVSHCDEIMPNGTRLIDSLDFMSITEQVYVLSICMCYDADWLKTITRHTNFTLSPEQITHAHDSLPTSKQNALADLSRAAETLAG